MTMAFLTGQSWQVLKSGNTGGTQKNDSSTVLQMDLTRVICGAGYVDNSEINIYYINYIIVTIDIE